jgi:hypothetical protein
MALWKNAGLARYQVRHYTPRASAMLPPHWAEAIGQMYRKEGRRVEIGTEPDERGEVRLTMQNDFPGHALRDRRLLGSRFVTRRGRPDQNRTD